MAKDYWEKRYLKDKAASINRAEDYLAKQQRKLYSLAEQEIQEEIEKLYQKFADSEKISLAEAKQKIKDADFRKIDWEGMLQQEKDLRRRLQEEDLPEEIRKQIEQQHRALDQEMKAYAKRGRISYLELRSMEIDRILVNLYDEQQADIYDYLTNEFDDGYYRSIFNTQQRIGFGYDFTRPNEEAVNRAILNRYDKRNFSKSLYAHCTNFSADLKNNLVVGLITGENLDKMARRIHKRMDVALSAARTLVRTETAYIYETATMEGYSACGIEWYEFLCTLDFKTSEICQEMDGKRFKVKDAVPGKNYPPMHPNCRSTTVCAFPEEDEKKGKTTRVAKDGSGKAYEVPADMTYKKWREAHHVVGMTGEKRKRELQFIDISISSADEKVSSILQDAYERRKKADRLHTPELSQMTGEIRRELFNTEISGLDPEVQDDIISQMAYLTGKYKTTCYGIRTVSMQEAVQNKGTPGWTIFEPSLYRSRIYLSPLKKEDLAASIRNSIRSRYNVAVKEEDYLKYLVTHEYGHTILNMKSGVKNSLQMDEQVIINARKEIRKIYDEYKDTMLSLYTERDNLRERINSKEIEVHCQALRESRAVNEKIAENFISRYAGGYVRIQKDGKFHTVERDTPDEFLAESFAMHELGIKKSPYAERVAEVLEKYFGW